MEKVLLEMSANWEVNILTMVFFLCGFSFFGLFFNPPPSSNRLITFFNKLIKPVALIYLSVLVVTLITLLVSAYIKTFRTHRISNDPAHWGQMGDFFGGMLNPILAFASFMALLYTIKLQSRAMEDTRRELKSQSNRERYNILLAALTKHNNLIKDLLDKPFSKANPNSMPYGEKCVADVAKWAAANSGKEMSLYQCFTEYIQHAPMLRELILEDISPILSECRRLKVIASDFEKTCLEIGAISNYSVDLVNPASFEQLMIKDAALNLKKARWLSEAFDSYTLKSFTPNPRSLLDKFAGESY